MIWRRSGAAPTIRAALLLLVGVFLPLAAEAQSFGRIIGGTVGRSALSSGTAIGADRRFVILNPQLVVAEGRRAGAVTGLAFDRDREFLLVLLAGGDTRWWDLRRGIERGAARGEDILAGLLRGGGRALEMVELRADGSVALRRPDGTRAPLSGPVPGFDPVARPAIAESGAMAFRMRDGTWRVRDRNGEPMALPDAAPDALPVLSPDGYRLVFRTGRALRVMRLAGGRPEPGGVLSGCDGAARITAARFTPAGGRLLLGDASGRLCLWDLSGGDRPRMLFSVSTALRGPVRALAMDREGRLAAAGDGRETVELWPLVGRIERRSLVTLGLGAAGALALDAERGWLLAGGGENGTVVVHDFEARDAEDRSRPVARLLSTTDGWSVLDRNGRFDGSETGIEALSWAGAAEDGTGAHVTPANAFSESHHEPGLLAKLDAPGAALLNETAADLPESGYVRPPAVTIELGGRDSAGRLSVMLGIEPGYPARHVAGLRLYRNGKLVLDAEGESAIETAIALVPGENLIRAIAIGRGGIDGPPATRTVTGPGAPSRPNLNVIAVGINDYANPAWELFYPRNDAQTMVSLLRERGVRLHGTNKNLAFNEVRAGTLLDSEARKEAIETLLSQSSTAASDILVVYFAGHGYALREEEGWDWYLLPWTREWRRRTGSTEEFENLIRKHGLSARRLMLLLTQTAAERVFLVLDSCYSGAVVEAVEGLTASRPQPGDDAASRKALRRIARVGGLHVLAASRAHETAAELQLEPHGALTWLVIEGMRGQADTDGDSKVSAREVIRYATAEMPNLADRLSQEPISQKPVGYSRGADFAIAGAN